jgi:hypothetical protein
VENQFPRRDLSSKPNGSLQGIGTEQWRFNGDGRTTPDGRNWTERELPAEVEQRSLSRSILVQEQSRNQPSMAPLTVGTLSTVRVFTLRKLNGDIRMVLASTKIPVGGPRPSRKPHREAGEAP